MLMHVWITRAGQWRYFGPMDHARIVGFVDSSLPDLLPGQGLPVENVAYFFIPVTSPNA